MRLLLDTHAFLWWVDDDKRLSRRARAAIADGENDFFLSLTSCWELAIKVSLGKLSLDANVEQFVSVQAATNGFTLLPVQFSHAARVARLPFHHRDPFDRMLAAQALVERLAIVSGEPVFQRYGVKRVW